MEELTKDTTAGTIAAVPDVNVNNPLSVPYRTGSYLIYDADPKKKNFRSAWDLDPHPYPASGSHQLDIKELVGYLKQIAAKYGTQNLFLVDLREETHGYLGDTAVSWYADNDFSNVGMSSGLIQRDEEARLAALVGETVQMFTITKDENDNREQQRELPVRYDPLEVSKAQTERQAFDGLRIGNCTVSYVRIPVTDHCGPTEEALAEFAKIPVSTDPADTWVHFHCHGGDGRTTSFLALYDIRCWKASGDPLPAGGMKAFVARQCELFTYCLDPAGCKDPKCVGDRDAWKVSLAEVRWRILSGQL
jgi:hypothetical protein